MLASTFLFVLSLVSFFQQSHAYTWDIQQTPKQCSDMTISVSGNDGKPPYRVLIIPYGSPPWSNTTEVRENYEIAFPGTESKVTFKMRYPGHSQFIAVVSDASGFATGGTSVATQVEDSDDSSCFDASKIVDIPWYFSTEPEKLVFCNNTRLYWNWNLTSHTAQGTPNFQGIIPGGQSFEIPRGPITDKEGFGTGFDWKPSLQDGTTLIIVAGDDRGSGTGGFMSFVVTQGSFPDRSCLNDNSPSSTPGTPAGAISTGVATNIRIAKARGFKIGAIVVGVVGGVVLVVFILLLLMWWRRRHARNPSAPREVWLKDEEEEERRSQNTAQVNPDPDQYRLEPFVLRHISSSSGSTKAGHRSSSSGTVVTVIQHEDAGPSHQEPPPEEHTVELPPAYAMLRDRMQMTGPSRELREKPGRRR